jgi:hypothetical protein
MAEIKKARKPNPWIAFVKKESARLGLTYTCAVSDKKIQQAYAMRKQTRAETKKDPKVSRMLESLDNELEDMENFVSKPKAKAMKK